MHIKAIQIKEQLLGQEDYEVALSVGHLASLYNYDMNQYEDAERLYLRSIAIGQFACFYLIPVSFCNAAATFPGVIHAHGEGYILIMISTACH